MIERQTDPVATAQPDPGQNHEWQQLENDERDGKSKTHTVTSLPDEDGTCDSEK